MLKVTLPPSPRLSPAGVLRSNRLGGQRLLPAFESRGQSRPIGFSRDRQQCGTQGEYAPFVERSSCGLQLSRVEQKIAGKASGIPVPVVADDDDSLRAADDGWAHPLSFLKAAQAWNRDTARWRT
jgi:hypothetical protein